MTNVPNEAIRDIAITALATAYLTDIGNVPDMTFQVSDHTSKKIAESMAVKLRKSLSFNEADFAVHLVGAKSLNEVVKATRTFIMTHGII